MKKTNHIKLATGLIGIAQVIGLCRRNALDWARIRTATVYLQGVDIVRDLFLYQMGILVSVTFLVFGVMVLQGAAIFLIPLQSGVRIGVAILLGGMDFSIALWFLGYFASSKRWLNKAAKYNASIQELVEEDYPFRRNEKIRMRGHAA